MCRPLGLGRSASTRLWLRLLVASHVFLPLRSTMQLNCQKARCHAFGSCGRTPCGLGHWCAWCIENGCNMNLVFAKTFEGKAQPCPFPEILPLFIHHLARTHIMNWLCMSFNHFESRRHLQSCTSRIWPSAGCTLDVFVERLNGGQAGPISVVGQADRKKPHGIVNVDVSFATIHHMSSYSSYIFSRFPWEIFNDTLKGRCRWLWFSCSGSGWAATRSSNRSSNRWSNRSNWRLGDPMCLWLPR